MKHILFTLLSILGLATSPTRAQEDGGPLPFSVSLGGKAATHAKGEAFAKIADAVGDKAAHVTALVGMELFEAVVLLEDISAVACRTAK